MYNIPKEFTNLYLKAVEIMKKLENERTDYEKRLIEVMKKYSFSNSPFLLDTQDRKKD